MPPEFTKKFDIVDSNDVARIVSIGLLSKNCLPLEGNQAPLRVSFFDNKTFSNNR